jgi:hypothetical protein
MWAELRFEDWQERLGNRERWLFLRNDDGAVIDEEIVICGVGGRLCRRTVPGASRGPQVGGRLPTALDWDSEARVPSKIPKSRRAQSKGTCPGRSTSVEGEQGRAGGQGTATGYACDKK